MGKMKRSRKKAHVAAVKDQKEKRQSTVQESEMDTDHAAMPMSTDDKLKNPISLPGNLFDGVKIDLGKLEKHLPDFDARSTITSKDMKGKNLTKVEKRKMKRDFLKKKVDAIQAAKKEEKDRKKRRKTPVVGDMKGLFDALPTLDLLLKDNPVERAREREKRKDRTSKKAVPKAKTRQKRMMDDIAIFNQVLDHPAFQSNPRETMKEHVKNWAEKQEMKQT